MKNKQRAVFAASISISIALAALCGTAGAAAKKTTKKPTTTKAVSATVAPTTVASATVQPVATAPRGPIPQDNADTSATVRVAYPVGALSLDPARDNFVVNKVYTFLVFDRLTQIDTKTRAVVPMLASSWKYASDGTYLEMKLRTDVNFSDGSKLDANAAKVSLDRYRTAPESALKGALGSMSGVTVVDANTLRINLVKGRGADLPAVLATSAGIVVNPKVLAAGQDLTKNLDNAGSGPYVLDSFDAAKGYNFNKAPGTYWDPRIGKLKRIEVQVFASTAARLNAVLSGAVELAHLQLPEAAEGLKAAKKDQIKAYKVPAFMSMHATLFHATGKLADVKVRQAISLAIDRIGIADSLLPGADPEIQPYPQGHFAAVPGLESPRWDPIKARQIIKDAGAEGYTFKLGFAANTPFELVAQQIQSQMKDIGLNVTLVPQATSTAASLAFERGDFDAYQAAIVPSADPATTLNDIYYDTGTSKTITDPAALKRTRDIAARALDPTLDDAERGVIYRGVFKTLSEELWTIPIVRTYQTWAYTNKSNLRGIEDMGWIWSGVFDARTLWVAKS